MSHVPKQLYKNEFRFLMMGKQVSVLNTLLQHDRWNNLVVSRVKFFLSNKHDLQRLYLLTPWSRVLLEKLIGSQLVKKFTTFYGIRRFITAFTSARHLSLSWASSIQSIPSNPTSWRSILIFPPIYAWISQMVSFPQVSPPKPFIRLSSPSCAIHAPHISFFSLDQSDNIWWGVQIIRLLIM